MTREEAITVFKAFMDNPLFSDIHKAAFSIAIHDIKQRHDWDINNLILINKDNYEPTTKDGFINNHVIESFKNKINDYEKDYKFSKEEIINILERYELKYAKPTTKNDLGVDCISREDNKWEFLK